ncbi:MAG: 5-formyltetrahydrofolate cyclo-ligase [Gammaproteobacteria bacterium]|nr:5-formyltetrahydrofolate cyclo-ligase [Gammaproteobacteria bacterium]
MTSSITKKSIRRDMRAKRLSLSEKNLDAAANMLANIVETQVPWLLQAKCILSYEPFEGEISPKPIIDRTSDSTVYLPRIIDYKAGIMEFLPSNPHLDKNKFGIKEPVYGKPISAQTADLILVPLTAFDGAGNRLGMGAGFYDRAMSSIERNGTNGLLNGPLIVGLAHHFQKMDCLPTDQWDVSLDAVISDKECIKVSDRFCPR